MKKLASALAALVVAWIVFLLIAGAIYGPRTVAKVTDRVSSSLNAKTSIDDTSLALVRGILELDGVHALRDGVGTFSIDAMRVRCHLMPLGGALWNHHCNELEIDGVTMQVTSVGFIQFKRPSRDPLNVDHVVIRDGTLGFAPSAIVPDLGRVEVHVEQAVAGPTSFTTPLAWIFTLRELKATFALPGDVTLALTYANQTLTATGSVLGSAPISIPLVLPSSTGNVEKDLAELERVGKQIATELVERRAKDWLRSAL
ncbi:MAG TPA: hypothetical protein VGM90_36320 [Kofleriaceae bacterium]|jgi:hypothetical protein